MNRSHCRSLTVFNWTCYTYRFDGKLNSYNFGRECDSVRITKTNEIDFLIEGEIFFGIYSDRIEIGNEMDTKLGLVHSVIYKKSERLINRKSPPPINSWQFEMSFCGYDDFIYKARNFSRLLYSRKEVISELKKNKDFDLRIVFYIRTGSDMFGYVLDAETMSNLAKLELDCGFDLIIWGDEET